MSKQISVYTLQLLQFNISTQFSINTIYQILENMRQIHKNKSNCYPNNRIRRVISQLVTPNQQLLQPSSIIISIQDTDKSHEFGLAKQQDMEQSQFSQDKNETMSKAVSQLLSKNKISSKNAFEVPLLDVSNLKSYQLFDQDSWSKVASTLEGSSKVYGYRVDCVSDWANKMTNSIMRGILPNSTQIQNQVTPNDDNNFEVLNMKMVSKKEQKIYLQEHLEDSKNITSLQIPQQNNSNNFKTRRLLDGNSLSGLILANIPIDNNLKLNIDIDSQTQQNAKIVAKMEVQYNFANIPQIQVDWQNNIMRKINQLCNFVKYYTYPKNQVLQISDFNDEYQNMNIVDAIQETYFNFCSENQQQSETNHQLRNQSQLFEIKNTQQNYALETKNVNNFLKHCKKINKKKQSKQKKPKNNKQVGHKKAKTFQISFNTSICLSKQQVFRCQKFNQTNKKAFLQNQQLSFSFKLKNEQYIKFDTHLKREQIQQKSAQNLEIINQILTQDNAFISSFTLDTEEPYKNLKCPHIRECKQQIYNILSQFQQIQFSKLYSLHQSANINNSQAIDFLSVLHLTNQHGYILSQKDHRDFTIRKQYLQNC